MNTRPSITAERVHIVGIGGIGSSAIARILLAWGTPVSGSDLRLSALTDELAGLGARIAGGHAAANLGDATLLLMSSAVPQDNPEIAEARRRGIPVVKRADILGDMMADKIGIAVAGTHGKTTTTAMITYLLTALGQDPTAIVGGIMENLGANARCGNGPHFVIEADEYDGMFWGLRPRIAVVLHLEADHPDCYPTLNDMVEAFLRFLSLVPPEGQIVACIDEPNVRRLLAEVVGSMPEVVRYGLSPDARWRAEDIRANDLGGSDFRVLVDGTRRAEARLGIPGMHNVKNALAAFAVSDLLGLEATQVAEALADFRGVKRRFEVKGEAGGVVVVDDYAHHPTEISATLRAARERYPGREIWAVFQPHTFSRTRALLSDFADAFGEADHLVVTDIYASRERDSLGMKAEAVVDAISQRHGMDVRHCATLDDAVAYLLPRLSRGHVLITLGAGDGYSIGERILAAFGTDQEHSQAE